MLALRTEAIVSAESEPVKAIAGDRQVDKYLLTASLVPTELGAEFSKLPPHITVLPPFFMYNSQKDSFDRSFSEIAEENLPFTIHACQPELFGHDNDLKVLPISGVFGSVFIGASVLAKEMNLPYDDTYHYRAYLRDDSQAMSFGTGEEVSTCGNEIVYESNNPHVTDYEGIIEPIETMRLYEIQLFCYQAMKKVVSIYRADGYRYAQE